MQLSQVVAKFKKIEQFAQEKLMEYHTQAFSWPEEVRTSFEENMHALSLQIQQKS
jgi:hypothetical protein